MPRLPNAISAEVISEAFGNYMGWDVYYHQVKKAYGKTPIVDRVIEKILS